MYNHPHYHCFHHHNIHFCKRHEDAYTNTRSDELSYIAQEFPRLRSLVMSSTTRKIYHHHAGDYKPTPPPNGGNILFQGYHPYNIREDHHILHIHYHLFPSYDLPSHTILSVNHVPDLGCLQILEMEHFTPGRQNIYSHLQKQYVSQRTDFSIGLDNSDYDARDHFFTLYHDVELARERRSREQAQQSRR